jgi:hypothetical protein
MAAAWFHNGSHFFTMASIPALEKTANDPAAQMILQC